jgi:heptosyltransferase-3
MASPRVLVIRGGAIGDFILTLPAIRVLRENVPHCHLEILGYPGIADLAVAAGLADAVRSLGHRDIALLFVPGAKVHDEIAAYLRSFQLVVSYLYDPDGHFRGNLELLGVRTLIECPHRIQPGQGHAAAQLARPLEKLAMFLDDLAPRIHANPATAPVNAPRTFILHPGSGSETKTWPAQNWLQVLQSLHHTRGSRSQFILITGEAEQARGLLDQIGTPGWQQLQPVHWHALPLPELAARLHDQALHGAHFLGHDSGISHLAAACGLPCLLLFGPTDPALWAPQNPHVHVVQAPGGNLSQLDPATVLAALP